jgi:hypothetical protein
MIAEETRNVLRNSRCMKLDCFGRQNPRFLRLLEDGTLQCSKVEDFADATEIKITKSFEVSRFDHAEKFGIRVGFHSKSLLGFLWRKGTSYLFDEEEERNQWLLLLSQTTETMFPSNVSDSENAPCEEGIPQESAEGVGEDASDHE